MGRGGKRVGTVAPGCIRPYARQTHGAASLTSPVYQTAADVLSLPQ
jgi:hypothetical protein